MTPWLPFGLAVLITAWLARQAGKGSSMPPAVKVPIPSMKVWEGYVRWAVGPIPGRDEVVPGRNEQLVAFHLAWIRKESGGNPAAIGANGAKGPDGLPREIGLYQLYNPDDFVEFKISPADFRAYCVNSLQRPQAEMLTRPLTTAEMQAQVLAGVKLVNKNRTRAEKALRDANAPKTWAWDAGPDYWRMVKLGHALPGLVKSGFRAVTKKLGRCPYSWGEFRVALLNITQQELGDSGTWRYHDDWTRLLNNAQEVGGAVAPKAVS